MHKRFVAPTLVIVLLAALPLGAQVIIEQVLVNVNGDILTQSDFERRQVDALRARPELANVTVDSQALQQAVAEITPAVILGAVDELLLVQRGRELGLVLGDEQFASIVENIREANNLEDEARFLEALAQEGMTMADLRQSLERQMLMSEVQRRDVIQKISVTEQEARAYYEVNKQQFTTPAEVTLREMLIEVSVGSQGINVAQDDEAKAEAEEIRKRLLAGEPFPRLAAELSDAPSKANGGLIGPIRYDELATPLQTLIDGMQVGELTDVLRTQRGHQILKLESRTEERIRTFDDARDDISNSVAEEKTEGDLQRFLERLRAQATITWRNDELRKAYEQALAERLKALAG